MAFQYAYITIQGLPLLKNFEIKFQSSKPSSIINITSLFLPRCCEE